MAESVTIPCADGYVLHGTLRAPAAAPVGTVLIHAATGVPERLYAPFAEHLVGQGWRVLTYDYRGIGRSRGGSLRRLRAGFSTWADQDVEAVTHWARARLPGRPLVAVGHSFGGHAIGLCASSAHLDGAVLVASQAGCLRFVRAGTERVKVAALLKIIGPFFARTLGYVPARLLGVGEDLPGGVALEWSRWTSLPRYFFDDPTMDAPRRFARPSMPVLAVGLDDDPWAPPEAIDLVAEHLSACRVERRQYGPEHSRGRPIGHVGFFRREHADTLWPEVVAWLRPLAAGSAA